MQVSYSRFAARGLERIGALSDGVFAIAMTLIVLEIQVPELSAAANDGDLWKALRTSKPVNITRVLSKLK